VNRDGLVAKVQMLKPRQKPDWLKRVEASLPVFKPVDVNDSISELSEIAEVEEETKEEELTTTGIRTVLNFRKRSKTNRRNI
jgi:hypothetical protein